MDAPPSRIPILRAPSSARSTSDYDSPTTASSSTSIQNLSSILNNPSSYSSTSSSSWYLWPAASPDPAPLLTTPSSVSLPEVTSADFRPYLSSVSESFSRFEDIRNHSHREIFDDTDARRHGQGDALVACLREVPALFFKEDFQLEEGATFKAACPFSPSEPENAALQERLTQYLDVVEMHLVREISLRSDSFFEAQGQLQGLNGEIVEACGRIAGLREAIAALTSGLVGPARQVQELNAARGGLVALQQKLAVILYVAQALSALKLVSAWLGFMILEKSLGFVDLDLISVFVDKLD